MLAGPTLWTNPYPHVPNPYPHVPNGYQATKYNSKEVSVSHDAQATPCEAQA